MTGQDVKKIRERLGYTQSEFGRLLGYSTPDVRVCELERTVGEIPRWMKLLVCYLEKYGPLEEAS